MTTKSNTSIIKPVALFLAVLFISLLTGEPCRASGNPSSDPTFTLAAENEPLGSVLKKVSQKTGWKIKAPEKWMDRPITQTLKEVTLVGGLRSLLQDAGIENLLLTYDEHNKEINIFDTDIARPGPSSGPASLSGGPAVQPGSMAAAPAPTVAPVLSLPPKERGNLRAARLARRRAGFSEEE